jgi:glycine hydroxymethyltransferase
MTDYFFRGSLESLDPELFKLTQFESERQYRRLILIPSESSAPFAVRECLASPFQNVYAEGYPRPETRSMPEGEILDHAARLAIYRRYSDPRYYKGVEYADAVEALARRRCALAFAANGFGPDELYANVQPLSGAPANNAVYQALLKPGQKIMGMNLLHGGHLTHGSSVNRSGKLYDAVHYGVDAETERIDYDAVEQLALDERPQLIIAGYSSYPWSVDWGRFREIADAVGAYLMADIAHVAGLVVAGVYPSPLGYADVITFTTHKSLCGPRGAVILTTSPSLSRKIDRAVFPGEQGGPHMNTILGQALTFKLAMTEQFKALNEQIVKNCVALTAAIEAAGFRIPFGGTDTHLSNVDCSSVTGTDGTPLSGDMAARILDVAGIEVNRNTIPGDRSAAFASGIRIGTPWITQRGFKEQDCRALGALVGSILNACQPYSMPGGTKAKRRAKVDFTALNEAKIQVREMAADKGVDFDPPRYGYPHFYYLDDPLPEGAVVHIGLEGSEAPSLLRWLTGARPEGIEVGSPRKTTLWTPEGMVDCTVVRESDHSGWGLFVPREDAALTLTWLRDASDGYVAFDPDDMQRKLPGPVVVRVLAGVSDAPGPAESATGGDKPWFMGMPSAKGTELPRFSWDPAEGEKLRRTALYETHKSMGAKMVPFAGWEMPVWYTSVLEEHVATREAAGLFDVSHMGVYQVEGESAAIFLDSVVANDVSTLDVGESLYTQFLDPGAGVIDDCMVYRRAPEAYLVVVNAGNDDKDWAWLNAVKDGRVMIDAGRPWSMAYGQDARLRNLRDPESGADMRVDIALQGPKSREILLRLGCDEAIAERLRELPWAGIMEGEFGGFPLVVSRTGYTGERVAYELFVHPDRSVALWETIMQAGEGEGLLPVGLGARDSLRTEAGLPLYGHEMAGDMGLGVGAAGFAGYVKTYKPWFIGRAAFLQQEAARGQQVARFRFDDKGVRMAHYGDPVVDRRGKVVGAVTSCAVDREGYLLGQAVLGLKYTSPGTPIAIFQGASDKPGKAPAALGRGDRVAIPSPATVLSRFM